MTPLPSSGRLETNRGLSSFRRGGRTTEVLFLYEITARRRSRLREIAQALGITVQATSEVHRQLARRGWVEQVEGAYRPTVRGVEALHAALTDLRGDLEQRLEQLRIVRRTRAVARNPVRRDEPVKLTMQEGILYASPTARGRASGRALHEARAGDLVEVSDLRGIVPLRPALVRCLALPSEIPRDQAGWGREVRRELRAGRFGLLVADGLEAYHLLQRATELPITRFGTAAATREASLMGVPVLVVATAERLPALLQGLTDPPGRFPVSIRTLGTAARKGSTAP